MVELERLEGNDLANQLHKIDGVNRVFVKYVEQGLSGEIVRFEGRERLIKSISLVYYQCLGGKAYCIRFKALPQPKLQCKDLSTLTILKFLAQFNSMQWKIWWANTPTNDWGDRSIANQFPEINQQTEWVLYRKMERLVNKGYVGGCSCPCRGDYYITNKGLALLQQLEQENA